MTSSPIFIGLLALGMCILVAHVEDELTDLVKLAALATTKVVASIEETVRGVTGWLRTETLEAKTRIAGSGWSVWRIVLPITVALICVGASISEYRFTRATLEAMGYSFLGPMAAAAFTGFSFVGGILLKETLGITKFGHTDDMSMSRRVLYGAALLALVGGLIAVEYQLGIWRAGHVAVNPSIVADNATRQAEVMAGAWLPVLYTIGAILTGWSLIFVLGVLWMVSIGLVLGLFIAIENLVCRLGSGTSSEAKQTPGALELVYRMTLTGIALIAKLGRGTWNYPTSFEAVRRWHLSPISGPGPADPQLAEKRSSDTDVRQNSASEYVEESESTEFENSTEQEVPNLNWVGP